MTAVSVSNVQSIGVARAHLLRSLFCPANMPKDIDRLKKLGGQFPHGGG